MKNFEPNNTYIVLLKKNVALSQMKHSAEYERTKKELTKLERQMKSEDIIQNTKIAFPACKTL